MGTDREITSFGKERVRVKVTVLVDNLPSGNLACEWGLSFYICYGEMKILLDMGQSGKFAENAKALGIDLADVDYAVLSHAHYDHADGMAYFFEQNEKAKLFIRAGSAENCYGLNDEGQEHYIGIGRGLLGQFADRITYVDVFHTLADGVYLVGHTTKDLDEAGRRAGMRVVEGGVFRSDCFAHEQTLVFALPEGLAVFNSCSHTGPEVINREVMARFPGMRILAYFGGLHLFASTPDYVRRMANFLADTDVGHIYTGHCTGDEAYAILRETLGDRVTQFSSGFEVTL